jgi:hypothetical protein
LLAETGPADLTVTFPWAALLAKIESGHSKLSALKNTVLIATTGFAPIVAFRLGVRKKGSSVLAAFKNYVEQNPNFLQIASTLVIGTAAYVIWSFMSKAPPPR